jgi:hypothetical protein
MAGGTPLEVNILLWKSNHYSGNPKLSLLVSICKLGSMHVYPCDLILWRSMQNGEVHASHLSKIFYGMNFLRASNRI